MFKRSRLVVGVLWTITVLGGAMPVAAQTADEIVGTWRVKTQPGTPDESWSLGSFNVGGTMSTVDVQESPGFGVWKKIAGNRNYAATLEQFRDFDSDGTVDARVHIRLTIHLLSDRSFTATATVHLLSPDRTQLQETLPQFVLEGRRMNVIRE